MPGCLSELAALAVAGDPGICGLRVRCSAYPNVHWRTPVQVTVVRVPRWTVLDLGELQLKLQLELGQDGGACRSVLFWVPGAYRVLPGQRPISRGSSKPSTRSTNRNVSNFAPAGTS